ncbi:MAG: hypothetical protein CSA09_02720 [Candidatus Contendobacter odensis]|uniref:Uncharacterized protein n=1 Tax=Candidatus Contendibacter odensensis TaxID=1400860 RepID=A0A2G6PF68_9GAMM|nr:MAG: hypothetical protein CSA09_02720 [Candidatus Contendobacter odensis]
MATYQELMKGANMGPIIIPGESLNSTLNRLIEECAGVDLSIRVLHGEAQNAGSAIGCYSHQVDPGAKNN